MIYESKIRFYHQMNIDFETIYNLRKEMDVVRTTSYFKAFIVSFFFTSSKFIQFCTFLVLGLTGDILTAEKAFLVASMYSIVNQSMACYFPFAISKIGEANASIKRIQVKIKGFKHAKKSKEMMFSFLGLLVIAREETTSGHGTCEKD